MEGSPVIPEAPESSSEKKESKKKKKSAEHLGSMLIEPKERDAAKAEKTDSLWDQLVKPKAEKDIALSDETLEKPEIESAHPVEELSADEAQYVEKQLVEAATEAEAIENLPEDPEAAPAIESFRHKIVHEGKDSDQAFEEVAEGLLLEDEEGETDTPEVIEAEVPDQPLEFSEEAVRVSRSEVPDAAKADPEPTAEGGRGATPPPLRPLAHGGSGGATPPGGGGPTSSGGGMPPRGRGPSGAAHPSRLDRLTPRAYERVPLYGESAFLSVASMEGVIGYLIGRRRGRLKTEKKLLPVQKKLEKKVVALEQDLTHKEASLRRIARERDQQQRRAMVAEHQQGRSKLGVETPPLERAGRDTKPESTEPRRTAAPEAQRLHPQKMPAERIGRAVIEAETQPNKREHPPENRADRRPELEKRADTMSRAELLELSDKIYIEGSSLHQIYETHLIGEKGLRRLVAEYLRGGDIKKQLRQEIVEREIDFERDPVMRDKAAQAATGGAAASNLQELLQKAGQALPAESEEVAFYRARAAFDSEEQARAQTRRRLIDASFVTVITILAIFVALLLFSR